MGIKLINDLHPQLVFLDIELQDGNGFEILDYFSNSSTFEVIFTTGLKDYKEKAMDYFAFYYLNKPIVKEQLATVIDKFIEKQSAFNSEKYAAFKNQLENGPKKISLTITNGNYLILDIDDIIYCEADGSYTHFFTVNNKSYTSSNNLKINFEAANLNAVDVKIYKIYKSYKIINLYFSDNKYEFLYYYVCLLIVFRRIKVNT